MIYFDNAATTMMYDEAVNAMLPYLGNMYGNPSEIYSFSTSSRKALNNSRKIIAASINASAEQIYFTSGGTESDNWAIRCALYGRRYSDCHIITTAIEHHAVINTCKYYEKLGVRVTYIKPNAKGIINPAHIEQAVTDKTVLISVIMANNEIGTIQNIEAIGNIAGKHGILFHTDAVQAFLHIPINVKALNVNMLSVSGHKCHGPKGIGFLYISKREYAKPFHYGGKQERELRAGTENVPAIAAFGEAVSIGSKKLAFNMRQLAGLRNHFVKRVLNEIEYSRLNGCMDHRLPGNVNISFAYVEGEALQIQLDLKDICCSIGSACNAGKTSVSHVLSAIDVPPEYIRGAVRFTFSEFNNMAEVDYTVDVLKEAVAGLRSMSSEYKAFLANG